MPTPAARPVTIAITDVRAAIIMDALEVARDMLVDTIAACSDEPDFDEAEARAEIAEINATMDAIRATV